jgi:iron(III) transport system permease protein
METLADYGTVSYFGVQTFTTGIYRAWFSLGDRSPRRNWRRRCSVS